MLGLSSVILSKIQDKFYWVVTSKKLNAREMDPIKTEPSESVATYLEAEPLKLRESFLKYVFLGHILKKNYTNV